MQMSKNLESTGIIARKREREGVTAISIALLLILIMVTGFAYPQPQQPPAGATPGRGPGMPVASPSTWQNPTGPYTVTMEEESSLPGHTVYRPTDLAALKQEKLPVITFSGPGCVPTGTAFRPFFTEVASHGYLILVNGTVEMTGGRDGQSKASDHQTSMDWAAAENGRKESKYYQRIDNSKVAAMGQSCGGIQIMSIAQDPRIKTLVMFNSGILNNQPATQMPGMMALQKSALQNVRVPIAYFVGKNDVANPNASDDFTRIDAVPVFLGILEIPGDAHGGTFRENNGGKFAIATVAWLKWQFKGNQNAAKTFKGADCGLCKDPQWEIRKKKID